MRRGYVALVVVVLASIGVPAPAVAQQSNGKSIAEQVLDAVDESLGADAAIASLRARDRGYDLAQLFEGVGNGLAVDGTITDDSGVIEPTDPPAGVLADAGEAKVKDALTKTQQEIEHTKGIHVLKQYGDVIGFGAIIQLMTDGYTLEQVVFDGLIAGGLVLVPFGGATIVEEVVNDRGKRVERVVKPGGEEFDEPGTVGLINDMVAIMEGRDPLKPDFKPKFAARLDGEVAVSDSHRVTLEANGQVGSAPGGGCCLGLVRGHVIVPADDGCDGEVVPITIAYNGFAKGIHRLVALEQSWKVSGKIRNTGGGTAGPPGLIGCIYFSEAPELLELLGPLVGPMRGSAGPGQTLTDKTGALRLDLFALESDDDNP